MPIPPYLCGYPPDDPLNDAPVDSRVEEHKKKEEIEEEDAEES
jgi:hypothetical protein